MKIGLAQKIVFVVAVPVLVQLVFISVLSKGMGKLADLQVTAQKTANTLLTRDRIYMGENQRMLFYGMYRATQKPIYREKFYADIRYLENAFRQLAVLWNDDPQRKAALAVTFLGVQRTDSIASQLMQGEKLNHVGELLGGIPGMYLLRILLKHGGKTAFEKAFHSEEEVQSANNLLMLQTESEIKQELILGLLLSLSVCLVCGLIFSLSISQRLRKVLSNIKAMEERKSAFKAVGGSDEIATLNQAIEYTAQKIRLAEAFQAQTIQIVADELDEPLQSISTSLSDLRQHGFETLSAKGEQRLTDSDSEVCRLRSLVTDLTSLHNLERASYTLEISEMDLLQSARNAVNIVSEFARSRGVSLTLISAESVTVYGDSDRIIQVVVNLLSNAVKFSPENSIVEIAVDRRDSQGRLAVIDRGPGISNEFRSRIFKRFEQGEDGTTKPDSSGLGLAICKELLESQYGQLGFKTKVGQGSTFWLALPLVSNSALSESNNLESEVEARDKHALSKHDRVRDSQTWTPTLWKKGLTVVVLPLVVQIITLAASWSLLHNVSVNFDQFTRATRIANIHSEILDHISRSVFYAMLYNVDQDPENITGMTREENKLTELLKEIDTFSDRSGNLSATTSNQHRTIAKHFALHQELIHAEQDAGPDRWFGPKSATGTEDLLVETQKPLIESLENEWKAISERTKESEETRHYTELVLVTSAILSGVLSALLGIFMVNLLTGRIKILLSHTRRFAEEKQLSEPITGNDELAFVDRRFYNAARKLLELDRFKNEMIALTSHELRTPLSSLLALTEIIENGIFGELKEQGKSSLATAQSNIAELIATITNLLDLEKMQSGKLLVTLKSTASADEILAAAVSNAEHLAKDREIDFRTRSSGLTTDADKQRMIQALTAVLRDLLKKLPRSSTVWLTSERSNNGIDFSIKAPWNDEDDVHAIHATAGERLALDLSKLVAEQHGGKLILSRLHQARLITISLPG